MEFSELKLNKPIPPAKIKQFEKKKIFNVDDLLRYTPRGYLDYRTPSNLVLAHNGDAVALKLRVLSVTKRMGQKKEYVQAFCKDETNDITLNVRWFDPYIYDTIREEIGYEVFVCGIFVDDEWGKQIVNPNVFKRFDENVDEKTIYRIYPIYSKIPRMANQYFENVLNAAIDQYDGTDNLPKGLKNKFDIIDEKDMIMYLHRPMDPLQIQAANRRLMIETLYPFAERMLTDEKEAQHYSEFKPTILNHFNTLVKNLPYELTTDQKEIINEFIKNARNGKRINALVQGDVGSGKTVCAILLMIAMVDNGYQAALMAPTAILAKQHYEELVGYIEPMGLKAVFLGSDMKAKEKREALSMIESGEANFIVGTHAVISDKVVFKNLGITIVDEEHKFGVIQRETLKKKASDGVHNISMSATPIPRSLAQVLYGNAVDIYTITTMPAGRIPIQTAAVQNIKSAFAFMKKELDLGHQCYIVCPLIENNSNHSNDMLIECDEDTKEKPLSVEEVLKMVNEFYKNTPYKAEAVTGKMKDEEKDAIIGRFKSNETQILIATTIIEVGVNVPNSTVITIMNAERFGLAGLHQLRGRVGRNSLQSYCMLVSNDKDNPRLKVMCETTNGFRIAEEDLKLRGTGDIIGIKQSGEDKNIMLMLKYPKTYKGIKEYILQNM